MKKGVGVFIILLILCSSLTTATAISYVEPIRIAVLDASAEQMPRLGDFDILVMDGIWLQEKIRSNDAELISFVKDTILAGVPTLTFNGGYIIHKIIGNLPIKEYLNQPIMIHGLKVYSEKVNNLMRSEELFIGGVNTTSTEMMAKACEWAIKRISKTDYSTMGNDPDVEVNFAQTTGSPYWEHIATHQWIYYMNPYGNLNMTRCWYALVNDGSNTYDWFNLVMETTSVPGKAVYGSDWRTADIWNWVDADYFRDPNLLIDYGPPNTQGVSTVNYQIGVEAGEQGAVVTCKMAVSYSVQDVPVEDQSDPSEQLAKWWHNVPEQGDTGMNPYTIKPGITMRVLPIAPTSIRNWYQVQYMQPNWFWGWLIPDKYMSPEFIVDTVIDYPRSINIFIVKASDSSSSWIENVEDVKAGILEAVNDANTRTRVKLSNEQINWYEITSTQDLLGLVLNPPLRAVIVNTHGETIPMPSWYFGPSIHITSPSDGQTIYSSPTVYADVYPPQGTSLQLSQPEGYTQWSYVWVMWYRPSTGASSWMPMYPNASGGGTYYKYISLPAYDTYQIYVVAAANNLVSVAHITVHYQYSGGGGGGCPYVSVWNGTHFMIDNNLLRGGFSETDITDYYKLEQTLVPNDGIYSLQLSEFEEEHNFIDQVKLLAIDHASNVSVAVSPYGEILTYMNPHPPVSAITNEHKNVKKLLSSIDGKYYQGYNGSYITLNFGDELDVSQGAKLVIRSDRFAVKTSIRIQVQDKNGEWNTVASFVPRTYWSTEIFDMTEYLPDAKGNLKVRLYFTANHKIDFVGLDTSPQATLKIKEGCLVSATHSTGLKILGSESTQIKATYKNLLKSDNVYTELTPGYRIQMNFTVPEKDATDEIRDFIFIVEGHYRKAGSPYGCMVNWQDWFDLLEDRTRNYGWIWTNVAGYSCYYFGNTWYESKIPEAYREIPGENGLKQFLSKDVTAYFYDGHVARRGLDFLERTGFDPQVYNDLPTTDIVASRPLPKTAGLPWNTIGYIDASTDDRVTASIAMNTSSLDGIMPGIFIHSGFDASASDWLKGYIASMLAIEEARAFLMMPKTLTQTQGNIHAATFSVTMLPGGWGEGHTTFPDTGLDQDYRYVDLMLIISTHYESYLWTVPGATYSHSLSEADFKFDSADTEVWAEIDLEHSGWETGDYESVEFLNDLGWWFVGLSADILGSFIDVPYLGSVVGLIPVLIRGPNPPNLQPDLSHHVWANGTLIDPNDDNWGTMSFYFRVIFRIDGLPRDYVFDLGMASWIDCWVFPDEGLPYHFTRFAAISFNTQLQFTVTG